MNAPQMHTVPGAMQILRIGRSKLYELIRDGQLIAAHIGGATRISEQRLREFIAAAEGASR